MQLDTRIPMMMGQMRPIRFQPESQLESLAAIAPGINAMRQMQTQEAELADAARKQQAFRQFQDEVSKAFPGGVRELAQVFMTKGVTQQHFETGQKLMQMMFEEDERSRIFGGGGAPAAAMPAQMEAPAAPTTMQMPVSEVAPEMAMGAAGGAQPRNAMMAMEAPAPAARAAAPAGMMEYAGKQYSPDQVSQMLQSRNAQLQQLGRAIADANRRKDGGQDEVANRMRMMGLDPSKQSDWSSYYRITQPGAVINEQRLELDRQRADLESKRFAVSQAKTQQEMQMAQRNLALSERRFDLAMREFERNNDPEFQGRMAAAKTAATKTAESDVAAINEAPAAIEGGQRALALLNRMVGDPKSKGDAAKPHPGFTGVVGATFTPGMRFLQGSPEADFDAMLEQVLGGAFLEAYERLKGTGQITEVEGKKATQAITRMGRAVSESEFLAAASEFRAAVETALTRTQTRLSRAQSRTAPAPTAQSAGAAVAPAAGGRTFPQPPQAAIDALKRGQGTDAQFDAIFGPGAAARARGR